MLLELDLFNYLNCGVWALNFAGSADETLTEVYNLAFAVNDFKDAYGACVFARSTAITFVIVNFDFNHNLRLLYFLDSNQINSPE